MEGATPQVAEVTEVERRPGRSAVQRVKVLATGRKGFLDTETVFTVGRKLEVISIGSNLYKIAGDE